MPSSDQPWNVELHDSLEPIEDAWYALANHRNSTLYQCLGLLGLLFRQVRAKKLAKPVVALARYPDGRPAALFPLLRIKRYGLRWLVSDIGPLDYATPIFDPALDKHEVSDIVRAVLAAVPQIDLAYFTKIPERFEEQVNHLTSLPNASQLRVSSWKLRLAGRSEEDLRAVQSHNFRHTISRKSRKLAREHDRAISIAVGDDVTEADFAILRELHALRTQALNWESAVNAPDWADFYAAIAKGQAKPCKPWLAKLSVKDEAIAMLFGLKNDRNILVNVVAMKPGEWEAYSPGQQVFQQSITYFHAEGAEWFDMSVGDMDYKRRFGCEELRLFDAMFPKSPAGWLYYLFWRAKVFVRSRMRAARSNEKVKNN